MTIGHWRAAKHSGPQEELLKIFLFLINRVSNYSTISLTINAECIWVSKYFCEKVLTCPALLTKLNVVSIATFNRNVEFLSNHPAVLH